MKFATFATLATFCAVALTACGGGADMTPRQAQPTEGSGTLAIGFKDASPAGAAIARSRRARQYLSFGTASLSIVINGGPPTTFAPTNCSNDGTGNALVCAAQNVTAPAGDDTVLVTAYSGSAATGKVLGTGTLTAKVTAGETTPVSIALDGVVANVVLALSNPFPAIGTPSTISLTSVSTDAQLYTIIGQYATPILVSSSDSTGETTLSKKSLTGSADSIDVTYTGSGSKAVTVSGAAQSTVGSITIDPGGAYADQIVILAGAATGCAVYVYGLTGTETATDNNVGCNYAAVAPNGQIVAGTSATVYSSTFEAEEPAGLLLYPGYASHAPITQLNQTNGQQYIFDSAGKLYVNNATSIDVYAPPIFSSQYPTYSIYGIAFGTIITDASDNLWLNTAGGLSELVNAGGQAKYLASIAYSYGQVATGPVGGQASFGPNGEIFVCDEEGLHRFAPGSTKLVTPDATLSPSGYYKGCNSIHVDRAGNVYVLVSRPSNTGFSGQIDVLTPNADGQSYTQTLTITNGNYTPFSFELQNEI